MKFINVNILKNEVVQSNEDFPKAKSELASGYDFKASSDPIIKGDELTVKIKDIDVKVYSRIDYIEYKTGIFISPEQKCHTLIMPRSSISKYNLLLANSIGLIDADYTGELLCRFKYIIQPTDLNIVNGQIYTSIDYSKIYKKGDYIAQLVAAERININFMSTLQLKQTERGNGGFGSTDEKAKEASGQMQTVMNLFNANNQTIPVQRKYSDIMKEKEKTI